MHLRKYIFTFNLFLFKWLHVTIAISDLEQGVKHEAVLTTKQLGEVIYTAVSDVTRYRLLYCNYNTNFSSQEAEAGGLCSSGLKKAHHHNIDFTCLNRLIRSPANKEGSWKRKRNKQKIFMQYNSSSRAPCLCQGTPKCASIQNTKQFMFAYFKLLRRK